MQKQQSTQKSKYVMIKGYSINSIRGTENSEKHHSKIQRISSQRKPNYQGHQIKLASSNFSEDGQFSPKGNSILAYSRSSKKKQIHSSIKKKTTSPAINVSKKLKTQSQATNISPDRRIITQYTLSSPFETRFKEDHHNTQSIAELLGHKNYDFENNDSLFLYNKQQAESRRTEIQKRKTEQNRQQNSLNQELELNKESSSKSSVLRQSNIIASNEDSDQNQEVPSKTNSNLENYDKMSKGSQKISNKKSKKFSSSNFQNQSVFSGYTFINSKGSRFSHVSEIISQNRPKIRAYSHEDKMKIIQEAKYTPKNQSQLRMERRYITSQLKTIQEVREVEEIDKAIKSYQKNKMGISKESVRKSESMKMLNFLKSQAHPPLVQKAVSLPKLSKPTLKTQPNEKDSISSSMTMQNYVSLNKKKKRVATQSSVKCHRERERQTQNLKHVQNILKSKGINYNQKSLQKGLLILDQIPEYSPAEKIQLPKGLISNPIYKKFPL